MLTAADRSGAELRYVEFGAELRCVHLHIPERSTLRITRFYSGRSELEAEDRTEIHHDAQTPCAD